MKTLESKETRASKEIRVTHNSVFAAHRLQCRMTTRKNRHPAFLFPSTRPSSQFRFIRSQLNDIERRRAFSLFLMFFPRSLSTAQRGYAACCGGAYEGYFSNFRRAGFIWSHVCASDVHTSTCGLNQLGSSRLAVLIATMSGCESVMTWIGEPQSGQKLRWVLPPASLGESWERSEPWESLKASDGTITKDENGPPLDRWQSLQ